MGIRIVRAQQCMDTPTNSLHARKELLDVNRCWYGPQAPVALLLGPRSLGSDCRLFLLSVHV